MITTKWRITLLFILIAPCAAVNNTESGILQWIQRKLTNDFYHFINDTSSHSVCSMDSQNTFLISEKQCVKDQDLFNGKLL